MTLDSKNLPTLRRRLAYLQSQYAVNLDIIMRGGKLQDGGALAREVDEQADEIDELSFVLRGRDAVAIGVTPVTILAIAIANGGLMLLILYLLFRG